jgi:nucleoside 2-deoxyribosyltransferase
MEYDMNTSLPSVYLAGPDVFFPNARELASFKRDLLRGHGILGLFPLDNEVTTDECMPEAIFLSNVDLIDRSDILLANIAPFRGPSLDPGTAWEIGYAYARGIPVICYGSTTSYLERCRLMGLEGEIPKTDHQGMIIEDFNEPENLMITRCASLMTATFEEAALAAKKITANRF